MNDVTFQRDREPLPTREQIQAVTDEPALVALEADLEAKRQKVEVDLEFASDKDVEWERRARGFLTAVRVTLSHVRKQLHRLRTAGRHVPDSAAQAHAEQAKAQRRLAHETEAKNALERKAQQQQAVVIQQAALNRKMVERLSYLHHFHAAAHRLLDEAECRRVSEAAAAGVREAAAEVLGVSP